MSEKFFFSLLSPKKPEKVFERTYYCPYCLDTGYIHVRIEWVEAQDIPFHSPYQRFSNETMAVACESTCHGNWDCGSITRLARVGSFKEIFGKPVTQHHYGATLKSGNFHNGDKMNLRQYLQETGLNMNQFINGQRSLYTPIDDIVIPEEEQNRLDLEDCSEVPF